MRLPNETAALAKAAVLSAGSLLILSTWSVPLASAQDYKPGDPITFGAAHKPMFGETGSTRSINFAAPQTPAATPQAAAPPTSAGQSVPNNFLDTRSIPWKPGDPVTFGSAHRPYTPDDNRPPISAPATSYGAPVVPVSNQSIAPTASLPVMPQSPATIDGDLREAPTGKAQAANVQPANTSASNAPARKKRHTQKSTPIAAPSSGNGPGATPTMDQASAANSGNFFSRAFHWLFGGK